MVVGIVTQDPTDLAWRIHGALTDWTGKVDNKASFALTIESAAIGVVIALSGSGSVLGGLEGGDLCLYRVGVAMLATSIVLAASAVIPRTRWRASREEWSQNFVYFGHLRHWPHDELVNALQNADIMPVMAQQLVVMSEIAWKKHVAVQASLVVAFLAAVPLLLAA